MKKKNEELMMGGGVCCEEQSLLGPRCYFKCSQFTAVLLSNIFSAGLWKKMNMGICYSEQIAGKLSFNISAAIFIKRFSDLIGAIESFLHLCAAAIDAHLVFFTCSFFSSFLYKQTPLWHGGSTEQVGRYLWRLLTAGRFRQINSS